MGQVQGPLQLSSTAMAWKEALGEVDVGKWDLIYRQAPVDCLFNAWCDALCSCLYIVVSNMPYNTPCNHNAMPCAGVLHKVLCTGCWHLAFGSPLVLLYALEADMQP